MKHKKNLIEDNKKAENQSFLYFLHEEKKSDEIGRASCRERV